MIKIIKIKDHIIENKFIKFEYLFVDNDFSTPFYIKGAYHIHLMVEEFIYEIIDIYSKRLLSVNSTPLIKAIAEVIFIILSNERNYQKIDIKECSDYILSRLVESKHINANSSLEISSYLNILFIF